MFISIKVLFRGASPCLWLFTFMFMSIINIFESSYINREWSTNSKNNLICLYSTVNEGVNWYFFLFQLLYTICKPLINIDFCRGVLHQEIRHLVGQKVSLYYLHMELLIDFGNFSTLNRSLERKNGIKLMRFHW